MAVNVEYHQVLTAFGIYRNGRLIDPKPVGNGAARHATLTAQSFELSPNAIRCCRQLGPVRCFFFRGSHPITSRVPETGSWAAGDSGQDRLNFENRMATIIIIS